MFRKIFFWLDIARTGAWIAFGCLLVLILLFPFVGLPLAFMLYPDERFSNAYVWLGFICVIYLALYFLFRLIIILYPWWHSQKLATKILITAVSLVTVVGVSVPSIVIPQRNNYLKVVNHFEVNWKFNLPDDAELKYDKSKSFGFVGGHDELAYAVFELKSDFLDSELAKLVPNDIRNLEAWNQMKMEGLKDKFSGLGEKTYAKLYFEQLLKDFPMQIPKRFMPNWNNGEIQWGLHGARVANFNQAETDACLFVIFTPSTKGLILYEFLVADH